MVSAILNAALPCLCSVALGYLIALLKNKTKLEKAMLKIAKASARKEIVDAYEEYVVRKKKLTVERYDELVETFDAYIELSGNGTTKRLWEEIQKVRPWIVMD